MKYSDQIKNVSKKLAAIVITITLMTSGGVTMASSATNVTVKINNNPVNYDAYTGEPFIDSAGRTQVPFRQTMEEYGAVVRWNSDSNSAVVYYPGKSLYVPIGKNYIVVDGIEQPIDTAATIIDGRTYIPIRAVIEALDGTVFYDGNKKEISIYDTHNKPIDYNSGINIESNADRAADAFDKNPNYPEVVKEEIKDMLRNRYQYSTYSDDFIDEKCKILSSVKLVFDLNSETSNANLEQITMNQPMYGYDGDINISFVSTLKHEVFHLLDDEIYNTALNEGLKDLYAIEYGGNKSHYYKESGLLCHMTTRLIGSENMMIAGAIEGNRRIIRELTKLGIDEEEATTLLENMEDLHFDTKEIGTSGYNAKRRIELINSIEATIAKCHQSKYGYDMKDSEIFVSYFEHLREGSMRYNAYNEERLFNVKKVAY